MDINIKRTWELFHKYQPHYTSLGLYYENSNDATRYFCTPQNAIIFASLGVGGVHFCTIPNYGEMIFVVSPEPCSERYVFPIASNINEFLQLIVTLHGAQLIDQIPLFTKERFEQILDNHIKCSNDDVRCEAKRLAEQFNITDINGNSYDIVMSLYNEFDYSSLRFTSLYYDTLGIENI